MGNNYPINLGDDMNPKIGGHILESRAINPLKVHLVKEHALTPWYTESPCHYWWLSVKVELLSTNGLLLGAL